MRVGSATSDHSRRLLDRGYRGTRRPRRRRRSSPYCRAGRRRRTRAERSRRSTCSPWWSHPRRRPPRTGASRLRPPRSIVASPPRTSPRHRRPLADRSDASCDRTRRRTRARRTGTSVPSHRARARSSRGGPARRCRSSCPSPLARSSNNAHRDRIATCRRSLEHARRNRGTSVRRRRRRRRTLARCPRCRRAFRRKVDRKARHCRCSTARSACTRPRRTVRRWHRRARPRTASGWRRSSSSHAAGATSCRPAAPRRMLSGARARRPALAAARMARRPRTTGPGRPDRRTSTARP